MKKFFLYPAFLLSLVSASCDKDKPDPPGTPPPGIPFWKKVQGTYKVTDLNTGEEFNIGIKIETDTTWLSPTQREVRDTIFYYNFGNQFTALPTNYLNCYASNDLNCLNVSSPHGIVDNNGNRWLVYNLDDTTTVEEENTWVNGVITFYFRMNNMAYWQADGTFYQDLYKKQRAVKISD